MRFHVKFISAETFTMASLYNYPNSQSLDIYQTQENLLNRYGELRWDFTEIGTLTAKIDENPALGLSILQTKNFIYAVDDSENNRTKFFASRSATANISFRATSDTPTTLYLKKNGTRIHSSSSPTSDGIFFINVTIDLNGTTDYFTIESDDPLSNDSFTTELHINSPRLSARPFARSICSVNFFTPDQLQATVLSYSPQRGPLVAQRAFTSPPPNSFYPNPIPFVPQFKRLINGTNCNYTNPSINSENGFRVDYQTVIDSCSISSWENYMGINPGFTSGDIAFSSNSADGGKVNSTPYAMYVQSDGKVLVGGAFTSYAGTTGRSYLIRLNSDGTVDTAFCTNAVDATKFNGAINSIFVQSDGKVLVGGAFTNYAGVTGRSYLIRLNSDGTLDTAFCTNAVGVTKFNGAINSILVQNDGKILVGGAFTSYAGTTGRSFLIRLFTEGTTDTSFCTNAVDATKFNGAINDIHVQSDGSILVGGAFTAYAATAGRSYLVRLLSTGAIDTAFCTNAVDATKFNSSVSSIAIQNDGKILVGGSFTSYAGTTGRSYLVRLLSTGVLDTAFCTNAVDATKFNNVVRSISAQTDGKILVGGSFINYGGTAGRNYLVGFNADGTLDTTYCGYVSDSSKFNGAVYSIVFLRNGKSLIGGAFTLYEGTTGRNYFLVLNADTTLKTFATEIATAIKENYNGTGVPFQSEEDLNLYIINGRFFNFETSSLTTVYYIIPVVFVGNDPTSTFLITL